jgi:hypothetical protein
LKRAAFSVRAAPEGNRMRYPDWSRRGDLIVFERGELREHLDDHDELNVLSSEHAAL